MTYSVFHADFHNASRLNAAAASRQTWMSLIFHVSFSFLKKEKVHLPLQ